MPDSNNISQTEGFMTRYKFLKLAFIIIQIWFVFPQPSKHTLNFLLQTSCLKIHFLNLQIDKHKYIRISYCSRKKGNFQTKIKKRIGYQSFCFINSTLYIWIFLLLLFCILNKKDTNLKENISVVIALARNYKSQSYLSSW